MEKLSKAIGYIRYSDKRQQGNHSLEIQQSNIMMLATKEQLEVINWCIDEATSAFNGDINKRQGIQQLIEDIKNGAEAVCFYEESRLTRQITDFYLYVYSPIKVLYPNVKFYSTQMDGEWDPDHPIVQTKLIFAAEESQVKSTRAKDTQLKMIRADKPLRPGARPPLGYDMIEGSLVPNVDLKIVLLIYFLAIWGHSQKTIAEFLNRANITSKKISTWNSSSIGYILNNVAYEGILNWNITVTNSPDESIKKDSHNAIVGTTMIQLNKQASYFKSTYGKMDTPFFLRGLVKCKKCDENLVTKDNSPKGKSKQYLIYKCENCNCTVAVNSIHEEVFRNLINKLSTGHEQLVQTSYECLIQWQRTLNDSVTHLNQQLLEVKKKQQQLLISSHENKDDLVEIFTDTINYVETDLLETVKLNDTIHGVLNDPQFEKTISATLLTSIHDLTNTEVRMLSLNFIEEVLIDFSNSDLSINYRLNPFALLENSVVGKPNL